MGAHISATERSSAAAERDAVDRFTAAFLQDRVGANFHGRVNGVTRFGLFVTLDDSGADGLIPISTLPDDFYHDVESRHNLEGQRWGRVYRLGERVRGRLVEGTPVTSGGVGRASCRERGGLYCEILVVAVDLKKKKESNKR